MGKGKNPHRVKRCQQQRGKLPARQLMTASTTSSTVITAMLKMPSTFQLRLNTGQASSACQLPPSAANQLNALMVAYW